MAASAANRVALYASVGPELTHYEVDVEGARLVRCGTLALPANVHYAWPHASRRFLYVGIPMQNGSSGSNTSSDSAFTNADPLILG